MSWKLGLAWGCPATITTLMRRLRAKRTTKSRAGRGQASASIQIFTHIPSVTNKSTPSLTAGSGAKTISSAAFGVAAIVAVNGITKRILMRACHIASVVSVGGVTKRICAAACDMALVIAISGVAKGIRSTTDSTAVIVARNGIAEAVGGGTVSVALVVAANLVAERVSIAAYLCLCGRCTSKHNNSYNSKWQAAHGSLQ